MIRKSVLTATSVASSSRCVLQRRALAATAPAFRQQERLPQGHVRPHKRPAAAKTQDGPHHPALSPPTAQLGDFEPPPGLGQPISVPPRPVNVPYDARGVLQDSHEAKQLLGHDTLVVVRQLEMMNVFLGYEQANKYALHTPEGNLVGFLAEEEQSFVSTLSRQFLRTHRPFRAVIMDPSGKPVLWIKRPFNFILSRIYVRASEDEQAPLVGEAQQEWHPWRRKYSLFQSRESDTFSQFAQVDSGFLAWDFWLKDKDDRLIASINRNFRGLGRELFTDTGQYVVRFDSAGTELDLPPGSNLTVQGQTLVLPSGTEGGLTLDQRAMTLAAAVSIDFDYFSRHSGSGGLGFPFMMWGMGDGSTDVNQGRGSSDQQQPVDGGAGAAAGAAGAAGVGMDQRSEDEAIYGFQSGQGPSRPSGEGEAGPEGMEGYQEQGWNEKDEEVMQDPYGDQGDDSWFGGGGGGDGDWGDWGS